MKKIKLLLCLLSVFSLSSCIFNFSGSTYHSTTTSSSTNSGINGSTNSSIDSKSEGPSLVKSHVSYDESKELIKNPCSGFYSTHPFRLTKDGVEDKIDYHFNDGFYHLRISLDSFTSKFGGEDIEIPQVALDSLDKHLKKFNDAKASIILRFAYDKFQGMCDKEPSLDLILKHVEALGPIASKYECVEAIECGLIGPWGEMHTSKLDTQETYNAIFEKWIESTSRVYILSRKPKYVYQFMGYTIDNLEYFKYSNDSYKRLGVFNDGYLGTDSDTGTYVNREKEVEWMDKFLTSPYGGEVITPSSTLTYIPNYIHLEQYKTHLSYLNSEWNDEIINRWKNTTIDNNIAGYNGYNLYNFMNNHMGYGFILKGFDANLNNDNKFNISISLDKLGYKKYNNILKYKIIVVSESETKNSSEYDLNNLSLNQEVDSLNEDSKVYLSIYDSLGRQYKLLNNTFDEGVNGNLIGEIKGRGILNG